MSTENSGGIARLKLPSVKLPKAVQMQVKRADDLEALQKTNLEKSKELKDAVTESFNQSSPSGAQIAPVQAEQTPSQEPAPQAQPVVAAPAAPEVKPTKDASYWEHRFKTAQGMYDAEKTRQKTIITSLESRLSELETKLRDTEKQVPITIDLKKYLTEEQIEHYGKESLEAVVKTAKQAAEEVSDRRVSEELNRQVAPLKSKLEETEQELKRNLENKFWENLNERVPNWVEVNASPEWRQWLGQRDPFSGLARQVLLESAQTSFDSERVVAMFSAFLQSAPAPQPSQQSRVVPDPISQTSIVAGAMPDVVRVSRQEIKKFYSDCAIGKYRTRPQEREAFEKRIRAAQASGNVY